MKDKVVYTLTVGLVGILFLIVLEDFWVAQKENRPVEDGIIDLLQTAITGIIGIVGTYLGLRIKK